MTRKIYLTESQFNTLVEQQIINESINSILAKVKAGIITVAAALSMVAAINGITPKQREVIEQEIIEVAPKEEWTQIADDCKVTVYNAVPAQCNNDVSHTASMFKLDLNNPEKHKIVAMERTFMSEFGLQYGDVIKIVGTYNGKQDGIYQIQDTMNKRFAGQHKVDVLVANNIHYGGTLDAEPAKIYVLIDKENTEKYIKDMAPQAIKK